MVIWGFCIRAEASISSVALGKSLESSILEHNISALLVVFGWRSVPKRYRLYSLRSDDTRSRQQIKSRKEVHKISILERVDSQ